MPIVSRSAMLLADMAKDYGAADQISDPSTLDSIYFRSFDASIVYQAGRDVFAFNASLKKQDPPVARPRRRSERGGHYVGLRKLRLIRPDKEAESIYGEVPVNELTYAEFARALDDFMEAVELARAGQAVPEDRFSPSLDLPSDELIWIKT